MVRGTGDDRVTAPVGAAQVLALGDPRDYILPDGSVDAMRWEGHHGLVAVDFPAPLQLSYGHPGQIAQALRCHPIAADAFRRALALIYAEGSWNDLKTFGGGYCFRTQRGSDHKLSTHAYGLAADFDVLNNPLGAEPRISLAVVRIFEDAGFTWGGEWRRPDGMHFQFCSEF